MLFKQYADTIFVQELIEEGWTTEEIEVMLEEYQKSGMLD